MGLEFITQPQVFLSPITAAGGIQSISGTFVNLSAERLVALSATINVVDITVYELSGFRATGDLVVDGTTFSTFLCASVGTRTSGLSSRFINLEHSVPNDGVNPVLFIGERGDGSVGSVAGSLSGYNITYNELTNRLTVSTQFGSTLPVTAVNVDSSGNVGIRTGSNVPGTALTIAGSLSASGSMIVNSVAAQTLSANETITAQNVIAGSTVVAQNLSAVSTTTSQILSAGVGVRTPALSSRSINLEHSVPNDGVNPVLFIGERGDGTGGTVIGSLSGFNIVYNEPSNNLFLSTQFGSVTPLTAVSIASNGNVGIGATIPNQALTVSGSVSATGDLRVNGNLFGNSFLNIQTGNTYVLTLSDNNTTIASTGVSSLSVYPSPSITYPTGYQVGVIQLSTQRIVLSGTNTPTVFHADGYFRTRTRYSAATLCFTGATGWVAFGDLAS